MKCLDRALKILPALALVWGAANAQTPHNTLSAEEAASGYQLLFNGTDFTGWRSWNSMSIPNSWRVLPDSLNPSTNVIQNGTGTVLDIVTADSTFQSFDYKVEVLVPSGGNSGMFIRYNFYNKAYWGGNSGPEMQIAAIDNSDGNSDLHRMGTCYDLFPIQSNALNWDKINSTGKNFGVYQKMRIIAYNNRVAHYGNGIKLLEYDMNSAAYNTAYNASKYKTYPTFRTVHPGGIMLQHHTEIGIRFRDIRIKKLETSPWAQGSVYLKNPADSTSGLKDSLPFDASVFPTGIVTQGASASKNLISGRLLTDGANYSLLLDRAGDYQVRVDDLRGKNRFKASIRNGDRVTIPGSAFSNETLVVRVYTASGSVQAFSRMVAPIR